jgi:hypothetical protein
MGLRICVRLSLNGDSVAGPPQKNSMATNYFRDVFEANGLRKRGTATYENPGDTLTPANVKAVFDALALLADLPASLNGKVDPLPPGLALDHLWTYIAPWPQFEDTRLVQD